MVVNTLFCSLTAVLGTSVSIESTHEVGSVLARGQQRFRILRKADRPRWFHVAFLPEHREADIPRIRSQGILVDADLVLTRTDPFQDYPASCMWARRGCTTSLMVTCWHKRR